jgi:hypothetical protein
MSNAYNIFVGRPEIKISLGTCRHIWKNNIKMNLKEIWCGDEN